MHHAERDWQTPARLGAIGIAAVALLQLAAERPLEGFFRAAFILFGLSTAVLTFGQGLSLLHGRYGAGSTAEWTSTFVGLCCFMAGINALISGAEPIFGGILILVNLGLATVFLHIWRNERRRAWLLQEFENSRREHPGAEPPLSKDAKR